MRMTEKKRAVLDVLTHQGPGDFLERGVPPYSVAHVAQQLGADLSNIRKTLQALERDGLVTPERVKVECWNAIAGAHMPRTCLAYWVTATMEQDQAAAQAWRDGARARSEAAGARMVAAFSGAAPRQTVQALPLVERVA